MMALLMGGLMLGLADSASAQDRGHDRDGGWWPPAGADWEQNRDGRGARGNSGKAKAKKGNGPPFCRNGQGHPVHGMDWCRD